MMAAATAPRRRKLLGNRRRVDDEGEEDGGPDALDMLDDDSLTEGSVASDEHDAGDDSDTSNVEEGSPTSPTAGKAAANGLKTKSSQVMVKPAKPAGRAAPITETDVMLNGLTLENLNDPVPEIDFDDLQESSPVKTAAPMVISSASASAPEAPHDRRRREHEEYRRKRDQDPAFVPNRGAFFMHDHRGAGPSANGFRPFSRGGGRGGRGRGGGGGGLFEGRNNYGMMGGHQQQAMMNNNSADPTTSGPWAHDMHEAVTNSGPMGSGPQPDRQYRHQQHNNHNQHSHHHYTFDGEGPPNGNGVVPRCQPNPDPINRTLSTEKHVANVQVRVFFPPLKEPIIFPGQAVRQYTKLPDHRPPLRRDKAVRISLPDHPPRYVLPASDRSFIFIPRAMRPNQQQRMRGGKPRSVFGSVGGFSRRTSIYGGGSYYGSVYSPSVAMSRRSSINQDVGRDFMFSPTGSTISRPPLPMDTSRPPVVRLPPSAPMEQQFPPQGVPQHGYPSAFGPAGENVPPSGTPADDAYAAGVDTVSINALPQPQVHPLPQKPISQGTRPSALPMHQPRPQKPVSVETMETPAMALDPQSAQQQAFHQQVPAQAYPHPQHQMPQHAHHQVQQLQQQHIPDVHGHHRRPSYPSHPRSTGTPLSQIPERAIHAAPFQPNANAYAAVPQQPQGFYGQPLPHQAHQQQPQPYPMMPPPQGYFYPPPAPAAFPAPAAGMGPSATAPAFVPAAQQQAHQQQLQGAEQQAQQPGAVAEVAPQNPNLITQEVNGMFYYYDASQLPTVAGYPGYTGQPPFVPGVVGMPGMMPPGADGCYYPQAAPGMMYYAQ